MRWQNDRRSDNVEDERGSTGMPGGPVMIAGGLGTLVILILGLVFGFDPRPLLQILGQANPGAQAPGPAPGGPPRPVDPEEEKQVDFVKAVLGDTEDVWNEIFKRMGKTYEEPKLKLYSGNVSTEGCGFASSAVGPFYCPGDHRVYLDLSFFEELRRRFKAPGESAEAYVIAHEIGHHVQNLLGISDQVEQMRRRASKEESNAISVRLELQADFLAGVWANHAQRSKNLFDSSDIDNILRAATAIGDDNIQKQAQGYVVPDAFTHGSSEQRMRWFRKGYETGDLNQGDTFQSRDL
jgi:uncharacterized protein